MNELTERDIQAEYDRLAKQTLAFGNWLVSGRSLKLPQEAWDHLFERYQENLRRLRELGDQLRPAPLRVRSAVSDELTREVLELFSAEGAP